MNIESIFKTFKEKFIALKYFPDDYPIPVTLALRFSEGKIFALPSNTYKETSFLTLDLELQYDETNVDFSALENSFKKEAPSLGFSYVEKKEEDEETTFFLGEKAIMNSSLDELKTAEDIIEYFTLCLSKTLEDLHRHTYITVEKEIKSIVFYWSDDVLDCIYLNYEYIPSPDFDLWDSDIVLRGNIYIEETPWKAELEKMEIESLDEGDGSFDPFEIMGDTFTQISNRVVENLRENPLFHSDIQLYTCQHDYTELGDIFDYE